MWLNKKDKRWGKEMLGQCIFVLMISVGATFNVFAQDELTPKVPTTTLEFDDSVYNFGEITEGKKVEHVFTFRNTGDEPLIISSAKCLSFQP